MQRLTVLGASLRHLSFISRPLLFLVIRLLFQTHHIKIYHSTWQSHFHRFTKAFRVAVHFTLANDLRAHVFLSWTPMKMPTTCRHAESAEAFVPLKSHLIGIMTINHALRGQDTPKDPEDPTLLLHP